MNQAGDLRRRPRLATAAPTARLMAGELGWQADRVDYEVDAWRRRLAAERAGQAAPDADSRSGPTCGAGADSSPVEHEGNGVVLGLDQGDIEHPVPGA